MVLEFRIQVVIKENSAKNRLDFWQERKLMSRQIKLRPTIMDHILNFLSEFVPCTRLIVNAWRIKVEHLI